MLENIIVKHITPKKVDLLTPKVIRLYETEEKYIDLSICKGPEKIISGFLDIKPATSKELYKLDCELWKKLISQQLEKSKDFKFDDPDNIYLYTETNELVDILVHQTEEDKKEIIELLDRYVINTTTSETNRKFCTDSKDGTTKLICYSVDADIANQDYTPVVLLELNMQKSIFKCYYGIFLYKQFIFIPAMTSLMDTDMFSLFLKYFKFEESLKYANDNGKDLYDSYKQLEEYDAEISVRELLAIFNKVGYKLELQDDNKLGEIKNLTDENSNLALQQFFNTFNLVTKETAKDIVSLNEVQKIFRYNKLTFLDVLNILSKEYLSYEGSKITIEELNRIIYNLYTKQVDKNQTEIIKNIFNK